MSGQHAAPDAPEPYYIDGEPACGPSGCCLPAAHAKGCPHSPPGLYHPAVAPAMEWLHGRNTDTPPTSPEAAA